MTTTEQRPSEQITETVTSWPGVEAGPGRFGALAFSVGGKEIGHLHGDHAAHFGFPRHVGAALRDAGRVGPHPVNPHSTKMAARQIESSKDVDDVIALMRENYERIVGGTERAAAFTDHEIAYLTGERRLARLATVGPDGTPHVVPVGFSYNAELDVIEVSGRNFEETKKFRDVWDSGRAAIVVDDLASLDPWHPRGVEVRGHAEALTAPRPLIRIHPDRVRSWGLA
jgi:pyridoxamine 5'-phosphate oxidase family protein